MKQTYLAWRARGGEVKKTDLRSVGGTKWFDKGVSLLVSAPRDSGREILDFIQIPSAARPWTTCQIVCLNRSSNNQTDSLPFQTHPLHLWSKPLQSPRQAWDFCLFSLQRLYTAKTVHPSFLFSCPVIFNFISSSSPTVSVPPHSSNLYFWAYGNPIPYSVIVVCGTVPPCWGGYPHESGVWHHPGSWRSLDRAISELWYRKTHTHKALNRAMDYDAL